MEELEKKAQELTAKMEAAEKEAKQAREQVEALKKSYDEQSEEVKAARDELKQANANIEQLSKSLNELNEKMEAVKAQKSAGDTEHVSLKQAIDELFASEQFKADMAKHKGKNDRWSANYEIKASTADIVTPITNSQVIPGANFPRLRSLAFIPNFVTGTVGQDKNRIVYVDGKYTSHAGYAGEGTAIGTDDTVSATEKTRQMAKISAKIKLTAEMFEDTDFIVSQLQTQMATNAMLFLDGQLYSGDGDDSSNQNHIWGLKGAATDFDAAKAGVSTAIDSPTVADLVDAVKVQASVIDAASPSDKGGFTIDRVFMNPVDVMKWQHTKDNNGNYVLAKLADDRTAVMSGVQIVETPVISANSLLGMESGLATLYFKRNMEVKIGQEEDDLSKDQYTMVLFLRAQTQWYENDKAGIIKVDDINAALTAIAKPAA